MSNRRRRARRKGSSASSSGQPSSNDGRSDAVDSLYFPRVAKHHGKIFAGGAFALVWGCVSGAYTARTDMSTAAPQIVLGMVAAVALTWSQSNSTIRKIYSTIFFITLFFLLAVYVYFESSERSKEDTARLNREFAQLADIKALHDQLQEANKELAQQKSWRNEQERRSKLSENPASLVPGSDYSVLGSCTEEGFANVILGSTSFGSDKFPFNALIIRNKPVLVVDRSSNGALLVSFDAYNKDGKLLARVEKNKIFIPPQYASMVPRSDIHHVEVIDTEGRTVLSVYFANSKTIKVTGTFYRDGVPFNLGETSSFSYLKMERFGLCGSGQGGMSFQ